MAEQPKPAPAPVAEAPAQAPPAEASAATAAAEAGDEGASTSKKAAKKAEAKAKKEAEKARRAAERAATAATSDAAAQAEDLAKDNYGQETDVTKYSPDAGHINLKTLGEESVGKTVTLRAWLQNSRMQGAKMVFAELREEGNWTIQAIAAANPEGAPVSRQMVKWIGAVNPESFVVVEGVIQKPLEPVKSCRVSNLELHITKCFVHAAAPTVLGLTFATANRPVTNFSDEEAKVEEGVEKLSIAPPGEATGVPAASMIAHLESIVMHKRAPVQQAIADIRAEVKQLFREYLRSLSFKDFEPPNLISAASEGGANVFRLPYFGQDAFLAQSPQFYKQIEIAGGRKRVFSIGPVFRAENSNTPRHMTEFTGLDLEMEIVKDYHEIMDTIEGLLLYIFRGIKERCSEEVELVRSVYPSEEFLVPEPGQSVLRLTFAEGQKLLREEGPEEFRNVSDDEDMSTPQEKALGALIRAKYKTDFFALDKFPEGARPFYAKEDPKNPKVTNAYDMFMRNQEILSGGQRINDPVELEARIRKKGVDPLSPGIKEYVDIFRQAGVPAHGGAGLGLDRVVAFYLNLPSVHLAAYYPRTPKRLTP
ncbi:tRNA synthetases class II-domain-containing protein [Lasiosphaeria miniovina]|uniref:Probable aspartate--tRNA ligase, cytoplasmic n=1 Tax=Lasiosphaeria miniovina TaxID=1954250 RepID=A0AA39ZU11_9PEZI|nr:tRNA synthetases class II-domain-containing protein [Lasiosphaeria miniovina]KAK0703587.1 tRNA synthetases class II-domain-containing protein [Lasiosphaeria miniovina]